jgi:hypothetical protein
MNIFISLEFSCCCYDLPLEKGQTTIVPVCTVAGCHEFNEAEPKSKNKTSDDSEFMTLEHILLLYNIRTTSLLALFRLPK